MYQRHIGDLIMDGIHWEYSEEGSRFWHDHYNAWHHKLHSVSEKNINLTQFLEHKYGRALRRTNLSQKQYAHALKIVLKYEERFGDLPSIELLKSLL